MPNTCKITVSDLDSTLLAPWVSDKHCYPNGLNLRRDARNPVSSSVSVGLPGTTGLRGALYHRSLLFYEAGWSGESRCP